MKDTGNIWSLMDNPIAFLEATGLAPVSLMGKLAQVYLTCLKILQVLVNFAFILISRFTRLIEAAAGLYPIINIQVT